MEQLKANARTIVRAHARNALNLTDRALMFFGVDNPAPPPANTRRYKNFGPPYAPRCQYGMYWQRSAGNLTLTALLLPPSAYQYQITDAYCQQ
eukprot:11195880-Lingulodinium_polyedra.AAC.1